MPELSRSRSGASQPPSPPPVPSDNDESVAPDPAVDAAAEDLAAAIAALDAATRKVRIAKLVQDELPAGAKPSAQAEAEDKLLVAVALYEAAERAVARAEASLEEARGTAAEPATMYEDADEWLRGWLLPTWRRQGRKWCAKWWLHAEAVSRIEAIWRAWEALRLDGTLGPSVWWRDHADYHLGILTSPDGPFARCSHEKSRHQLIDPLTAVPNPAKLDHFLSK